MAKIRVLRPFHFSADPKTPARSFVPGEYTLTDAEMKHWFIQGCIKDGLAEEAIDPEILAAIEAAKKAAEEEAAKKAAEDEAAKKAAEETAKKKGK